MSDSDRPEKTIPPETEPDTDQETAKNPSKEHGGPKGPEPTRYGDWEKNGRCIDF